MRWLFIGPLLILCACHADEPAPKSATLGTDAATSPVEALRLDSPGAPVDFDADGKPDTISVVAASAPESASVDKDAFGYGESPPDTPASCLKISLAAATQGSVRILCGRSPVMVLQQPPPQDGEGRRVPKDSEELPEHVRSAAKGDVFTLQTQATDLAIYWTDSGFRWEELSAEE